MNTKPNQFRMPGYNPIDRLDGSTRLRMAQQQEARAASSPAPAAVMSTEPARTATAKEAMAAAIILVCFTGVFWILIGFIRTH